MRSSATFIVAGLATLALSSTALAAKTDKSKSQEKTARAACLMGDYQKGTKILVDLFIQTGNPVHLFNQGRCYEQNHRWEEAADRFHEYLRKAPNLDENTTDSVNKHIAECESHLPKAMETPAPIPPPTPPAPELVSTPSPAPEPVPAPPVPTSAPQESGSGLRIAGLITAGVGVAALATAVVLNIKHESLAKEQNKPGNFSDSRESTLKAYKTWSWVGYGVGAAAVLAGGIMYISGRSSGHDERQAVSLMPVFEARGVGCLLQGAF